MFGNKDKSMNIVQYENKIRAMQEIIDKQNKELIDYRWLAIRFDEIKEKQRTLDTLIKTHSALCEEVKDEVEKYRQLNEELKSAIADCKNHMYAVTQSLK